MPDMSLLQKNIKRTLLGWSAMAAASATIGAGFMSSCNSHSVLPLVNGINIGGKISTTVSDEVTMDILWVVDNSGSMCQEQKALRDNFNEFVDTIEDASLDFHIAVTTTHAPGDDANYNQEPVAIEGHIQSTPQPIPGTDIECIGTYLEAERAYSDFGPLRDALALAVDCMSSPDPSLLEVTDAQLVEVQVSPRRVEVPVDNYVRFFATAIYSDGTREDVSEEAQWKSDDQTIMSVTVTRWFPGIGTALAPGATNITAQYGGLVGEAEAIVTEAELVEVRVSPFGLELQPGVEFQFLATAIFSDGTSRDVTFLSKWISADGDVVDVLDDWRQKGKAFSVRPGTVEVTATYRETIGRATITVTPATITQIQVIPFDPTVNVGDEIRFFATALYSDGTSLQVWRDALWQTTESNIATVSNARWYEGVTTAHAPGTARILATYNGVTGEAELTVQGKRIDRIQVTPFLEEIPTGYYLQLYATAIYDDGTSRDITGAATWTSSARSVADVYTSFWIKGIVLGASPGSTFVEATYQGVSGRMNLTVTDAVLQDILLDPPMATVEAGERQEFEATGVFSDGTEREVTWYVTWSSTDTNTADVSNAWVTRGEATGFAQGTTTIQASQGSVTGSATLDVSP